jgi:hypothetical protein
MQACPEPVEGFTVDLRVKLEIGYRGGYRCCIVKLAGKILHCKGEVDAKTSTNCHCN